LFKLAQRGYPNCGPEGDGLNLRSYGQVIEEQKQETSKGKYYFTSVSFSARKTRDIGLFGASDWLRKDCEKWAISG
jgi:hypothetical protein